MHDSWPDLTRCWCSTWGSFLRCILFGFCFHQVFCFLWVFVSHFWVYCLFVLSFSVFCCFVFALFCLGWGGPVLKFVSLVWGVVWFWGAVECGAVLVCGCGAVWLGWGRGVGSCCDPFWVCVCLVGEGYLPHVVDPQLLMYTLVQLCMVFSIFRFTAFIIFSFIWNC